MLRSKGICATLCHNNNHECDMRYKEQPQHHCSLSRIALFPCLIDARFYTVQEKSTREQMWCQEEKKGSSCFIFCTELSLTSAFSTRTRPAARRVRNDQERLQGFPMGRCDAEHHNAISHFLLVLSSYCEKRYV